MNSSVKYPDQLKIIADAAHAFASVGFNLSSVLDEITHRIVETLGNGCTIRLVSEDEKSLEPTAFYHSNPDAIEVLRVIFHESSHMLGEGLAGKVAQTGKSEMVQGLGQEDMKKTLKKEHWVFLDRFRIHSLMAVPLKLKDKVIGVISVYRDDTPESYTEEDVLFVQAFAGHAAQAIENARLHRISQEAIRTREEFLLMATHELNTPLTALILSIETITRLNEKSADPQNEKFTKLISIMDNQVTRLRKIVQTLVGFLKAKSGRIDLKIESVELNQLVTEVESRLKMQLESTTSKIIHGKTEPVTGLWDRFWLEQVVGNLLANAIKYGNGKPIHIDIENLRDQARFTVRDEGIGIDPDKMDVIFEPFERAVSVSNYGGFGIGLYVVKRMTEEMGGQIQVTSQAGKGSAFSLELPLNRRT